MLMITYALLPCTVVLEFNPAQPEDLNISSRHCYLADAPAILKHAGEKKVQPRAFILPTGDMGRWPAEGD